MIGTTVPVQVRDLAAMRVAMVSYSGPPGDVGVAFERLTDWVEQRGLFPAGPLIAAYRALPAAADGAMPDVQAELMVPLTRLLEDEGDVRCVRVPSMRAACVMFDGAMDARFRVAHEGLFAWIDARELTREGTAHHHAYIRTGRGLGHWTVEIRVPVDRRTP
jgi:effector-binding domain-containing protein